ncbi:MAG: hypothetical protein L0K86_00485 [Actinomycetia bacterium]|nr:hypothetical protein [Actinomycetes bacterium]
MESTEHPLAHVVGRTVPGGQFSIAPYESWLAHDALYASPDPDPHPVMAFVAAQRGMGCTVAELFELLESNIDDGPLLASTSIDIATDLRVDARYGVSGEVVSIDRKHGEALGAFDLVTCRFDVRDDAAVVATVTNVYAVGRNQ